MRSLLFSGLLTIAVSASAETLAGRVVGVADGDTLTLLDANHQQYKIRLSGIDAPEKHQAFGARSKTSLSALAFDQEVTAECPRKDRYGRWICVVSVHGKDIGLEQVTTGMAWWYRQYAKEQTPQARGDYEQAEFWAKARRLGLWRDKNPTPPWEWRRALRSHED
jgi:endonuclease YncB( thermonuclease family)